MDTVVCRIDPMQTSRVRTSNSIYQGKTKPTFSASAAAFTKSSSRIDAGNTSSRAARKAEVVGEDIAVWC